MTLNLNPRIVDVVVRMLRRYTRKRIKRCGLKLFHKQVCNNWSHRGAHSTAMTSVELVIADEIFDGVLIVHTLGFETRPILASFALL